MCTPKLRMGLFLHGRRLKKQRMIISLFEAPQAKTGSIGKQCSTCIPCVDCKDSHGKVYSLEDDPNPAPPIHPNCRCQIVPTIAIEAGRGTKDGENGADWWMKHHSVLPEYYASEFDFRALGWKPGQSPSKFAEGKMMTRGIYLNDDGHLPSALGRIWYEADINYYDGKRNKHRLLWSNDGLLFTTYDHYGTFHEIV